MQFILKKMNHKEAMNFCKILSQYSCIAVVRADRFDLDAKSVLGVILVTNNADKPILEISELDDRTQNAELVGKLTPYIKDTEGESNGLCYVCKDPYTLKTYESAFSDDKKDFKFDSCPLCGKKLR